MKWPRLLFTFLLLLLIAPCYAQEVVLTSKASVQDFKLGEAISFKLGTDSLPEGAVLRGDVMVDLDTNAKAYEVRQFPQYNFGLWGTQGMYHFRVMAMWGVKHPDVEGAWLDFGLTVINEKVHVEGGDAPNPPLPPTPHGPYKVWFLEEISQRDNLPTGQRQLMTSLVLRERLEALGHKFQQIVTKSIINSPPDSLLSVAQAAREAQVGYPAVALESLDGGDVKVIAMPDNYEALAKLLDEGVTDAYR